MVTEPRIYEHEEKEGWEEKKERRKEIKKRWKFLLATSISHFKGDNFNIAKT